MANAVFTTKVSPAYDDLPELRYHFPSTYLNQIKETIGDWIIYYEPRRPSADLSSHGGRQCYFATARVDRIETDKTRTNHYYAHVSEYLEFPTPVPFINGKQHSETGLRKADGSTNKGRMGRAARLISSEDFLNISKLGFADASERPQTEGDWQFADEPPQYDVDRRKQIMQRPFRDAAFTRAIQKAYENTCAMTGLKLINGGGRCEIEAAHIKSVEDRGPDSPRNGIALSRTVHWMFDRHFLSVSDSGEILVAKKHVPEPILRLLNPDGKVRFPTLPSLRPHSIFLKHHRDLFKGD